MGEEKGLSKPKISLQFELSTSGLVQLIKAEGAVEETYTVTEEEEVEVDDEEDEVDEKTEDKKVEDSTEETEEKKDEDSKDESSSNSTEDKEAKAEPEKKKKKTKMITVEKEKKKTHKRTLTVSSYHAGLIQPHSDVIMSESREKLGELNRLDKERQMLEEVRNNYESYIYLIKNKLIDDEEAIGAVTTQEQRDELKKSADEAEDWMYEDGYDASLETYKQKYEELTKPAEKVFFRMTEVSARAEAIVSIKEKLDKVVALMKKWEKSMPQIKEEERDDVLAKVEDVRKWITEKEEAQAANDPASDPVFTSEEVPLQTKDLQSLISKLSRRPKPAPKKEEKKDKKNETDAADEKKEDDKDSESGDKNETSSEEKETADSEVAGEGESAEKKDGGETETAEDEL